ncbi:pyruvate flavodoxin/ferredoxin oxidoreductase domain-containing protein [Ignicoccus islandicus DSM 13165]|uniref:2-oxoacid oxidoreductase (ferredoxin) n=1 Tax=Ignicoccus islandicus DSM 13165 TaxID=940295 RepID=A0A0U3EB88_9CREN|nr:ferredoxin oxidoreductase [Ignicoccus islandicus]ALU11715.1 pyruvate flavodoxin/ferredoxin oxidoreductase domain-containing protein [Ignicoccus islandicus DSM 13165]
MVRKTRKALTTNYAVAHAAKDSDVDVVAAYPITPSTPAAEKLAEFVANGEMDAEYIHVESEHSAASALVGASAVGARAFTVTASQGLVYMAEVLYIASGLRLPIVLGVASRALSAPLSIWGDMHDIAVLRDAGLIIYFVSSAQEAYDTVIQAFKVAEDPRVHLPAIVDYDGFVMSHVTEPVDVYDKEDVLKYIPKKITWKTLNPKNPVSMGVVGDPDYYYEFKYQQQVAMENALKVAEEADEKFGEMFGHKYGVIETYRMDDAEVAMLAYGAHAGTARVAVDEARKEGIKVGLIRLRLWRPFPTPHLRKALENVSVVGVLDRAFSLGAPRQGPVSLDVMSMYASDPSCAPKLASYTIGIGQRDVRVEDLVAVAKQLKEFSEGKQVPDKTIPIGLRE